MRKNLANIITLSRIFLSLGMFFFKTFSCFFFILLSLSGITDVLDGFIARKLNISSQLGALLDSLSDFIFLFVVTIKCFIIIKSIIMPIFYLLIAIILVLKCLTYFYGYIKFKTFTSVHTILNKLTGLLIFCAIFFLGINEIVNPVLIILSCIAILTSIEELLIVINQKDYNPNQKSLFQRKKNKA